MTQSEGARSWWNVIRRDFWWTATGSVLGLGLTWVAMRLLEGVGR